MSNQVATYFGDVSRRVHQLYWNFVKYASNPVRVIFTPTLYNFVNMWRVRLSGLHVIGEKYGSNQNLPGQVVHQQTDGTGF